MPREVDVAILGSGSAGLNALGQVKKAGKSFVMINGGEFGTTCARVGCMPSKALIQIAEDFHRRSIFNRHAIAGGNALTLDREAAMEHIRDLRDTFVDRITSNSTDKMPEQVLTHTPLKSTVKPSRLVKSLSPPVRARLYRRPGKILLTKSSPLMSCLSSNTCPKALRSSAM